jgi:hypothetical protein
MHFDRDDTAPEVLSSRPKWRDLLSVEQRFSAAISLRKIHGFLDGMRRLVSRNELKCCPQRTRSAKRESSHEED